MDAGAEIATESARIRTPYNLALPNTVHLATALASGAETFITNDRRLRSFPELPVTIISDVVH